MAPKKDVTVDQLLCGGKGGEDIKQLTFEEGLGLLEQLVTSVEGGSLPLDRAMASYEIGLSLVDHLRGLLTGAEEKLKILQRA